MTKESVAEGKAENAKIVTKEEGLKLYESVNGITVLADEGERYKHYTVDNQDGKLHAHEGTVPQDHVYIEFPEGFSFEDN